LRRIGPAWKGGVLKGKKVQNKNPRDEKRNAPGGLRGARKDNEVKLGPGRSRRESTESDGLRPAKKTPWATIEFALDHATKK